MSKKKTDRLVGPLGIAVMPERLIKRLPESIRTKARAKNRETIEAIKFAQAHGRVTAKDLHTASDGSEVSGEMIHTVALWLNDAIRNGSPEEVRAAKGMLKACNDDIGELTAMLAQVK